MLNALVNVADAMTFWIFELVFEIYKVFKVVYKTF